MTAVQNRFKQGRPCRPRCGETQQLFGLSMPAQADMEPQPSAPSGGSDDMAVPSVGAL